MNIFRKRLTGLLTTIGVVSLGSAYLVYKTRPRIVKLPNGVMSIANQRGPFGRH